MTDAFKKRALAGPTVGEQKQEEVCPERHGNSRIASEKQPKWIKIQCSCGFLMGYRWSSEYWTRSYPWECVTCHRKRHG